jgi:ABC-type transporter lipoprotein component MlaA
VRAALLKADMLDSGKAIVLALVGPLPLRDVDGMGAACIQLLKTLDPAVTENLVQYSTAKNVTTALGALWEVSVESKDQTVMIRNMSKSYVTSNPVKSQWYERFLSGMHKSEWEILLNKTRLFQSNRW